MQRRGFIQGVLAGGAGLVSATAARAEPSRLEAEAGASAADVGPNPPTSADITPPRVNPSSLESATHENLWPLLSPARPGDFVGLGWRVAELGVVRSGAAVMVLKSGERTERVHLCRRDRAAHGVVHSEHLDLVLMNHGDGASPSDESLARVLNVLAELIRRNEALGVTLPEGLLSHDSRMAFFRSEAELL